MSRHSAPNWGSPRRVSAPRGITRRALLGAVGGTVAVGVTACGGDEVDPTLPAETPTTEAAPTATQDTIASPIASYLDPERWAGRSLTVASFGGDYQEAQAEAYFAPFALDTGAEVRQETPGSTATTNLRRQVDEETVIWDVVCIATDQLLPLAREGYLEEMDYAVVDRTTLFTEIGVAATHGVAADLYSTVIAYPAETADAPASWADFWDATRFGEHRSLRKDPVGTLEFALLAAGVPADRLYPLDLDLAFASLDKIKPLIPASAWWEDQKQPVELVANGAVGLASAWNVRTDLPDVRGKVRVQWAGGMLSPDWWVVPRGTPNRDLAMDFISYATRARPNANFCRLRPFGPVNREALALLRPDRLAVLPTAEPQRTLQFVEDWTYWADNREAVRERFLAWLEEDDDPTGTPA